MHCQHITIIHGHGFKYNYSKSQILKIIVMHCQHITIIHGHSFKYNYSKSQTYLII